MRGVPPGAHGDLCCAIAVYGDAEDLRGALDDEAEFVVGVELQAQENAEAGTHGGAQEPRAGGGGDEGERLDVEDEGAGRRAGADHNIEGVILEGGVELFLEDGLEAMDFVEEERPACL